MTTSGITTYEALSAKLLYGSTPVVLDELTDVIDAFHFFLRKFNEAAGDHGLITQELRTWATEAQIQLAVLGTKPDIDP